jgi:hypothetical protein
MLFLFRINLEEQAAASTVRGRRRTGRRYYWQLDRPVDGMPESDLREALQVVEQAKNKYAGLLVEGAKLKKIDREEIQAIDQQINEITSRIKRIRRNRVVSLLLMS